MGGIWIYANIVLPIIIVAIGVAGVVFLVPWIEKQDRQTPGE